MKEATLTAEFIIIGSIGVLNIFFLGLILFEIKDFSFLESMEKYKEIFIILILAISYYFGGLTHRLTTLWDKPKSHSLIKKRLPCLKYVILSEEDNKPKKRNYVYQYGSVYLTSLIAKEDKFLMLFKCFSIISIPSSLIFSIWLFRSGYGIGISIFVLILLLIVSFLSFRAHKRQSGIYWNAILGCYDLLTEGKEENNISSH